MNNCQRKPFPCWRVLRQWARRSYRSVRWRAGLTTGCLLLASSWQVPVLAVGDALPEVDVYADIFPPFIRQEGQQLTGPWIQAFAWLTRAQGMVVHFHPVEQPQLLQQVQGQPGSCGLGVSYSAGASETVRYVGRIAPVTLSLYARRRTMPRIDQLTDLHGYRIAAVNEAELVRRLDQAGLDYRTVQYRDGRGMDLLMSGQVDVLISDLSPSRLAMAGGERAFVRLASLLQVERWLVCNTVMPVPALNRLRMALREGMFASETAPFWERAGLHDYYRQVRALWMEGPPATVRLAVRP